MATQLLPLPLPFQINHKHEVNETYNIASIKRLKTTYDENEKVPRKKLITSNSINMHHMIETLDQIDNKIGNSGEMMQAYGGIIFFRQETEKTGKHCYEVKWCDQGKAKEGEGESLASIILISNYLI